MLIPQPLLSCHAAKRSQCVRGLSMPPFRCPIESGPADRICGIHLEAGHREQCLDCFGMPTPRVGSRTRLRTTQRAFGHLKLDTSGPSMSLIVQISQHIAWPHGSLRMVRGRLMQTLQLEPSSSSCGPALLEPASSVRCRTRRSSSIFCKKLSVTKLERRRRRAPLEVVTSSWADNIPRDTH